MHRARHKKDNRFKCISFSERISHVNIDVFHRIPHRFEEESAEKCSYFFLAVQKWTVLNLTEKWRSFRKEIGNGIVTLPQILNCKEKIVEVFFKRIKSMNEHSLQPVLELIVALVKDLRHEFYPFYPRFLKELINLLKHRDPEVLESTFTCLAYIFKYLSKELVKDLDKVLLDLAPLLNENNPEYVTDFAAQSFSFVARKVKDRNKLLSLVLYAIQCSPQISVGCGQLVFEMMRGIKGHSHSCAEELLPVLLNSHGKSEIPQKTLHALTCQVVEAYGNNINPQYSVLFKVFVEVLNKKVESEDAKGMKKLLKLLKIALNCKDGAHLNDCNLPHVVSILVKLMSWDIKVQRLTVSICADMLLLKNLKLPQEFASRIITKVMQSKEVPVLLQFLCETCNCAGFEISILPRAFQNFSSIDSPEFLQILAKIVIEKTTGESKTFGSLDVYPLTLTASTLRIFNFVLEILKKPDSDLKTVLSCLILIRHLEPKDPGKVVLILSDIIMKSIECVKTAKGEKLTNLFVLCVTLESLLYFKKELTDTFIDGNEFCEVMLKILQTEKSILALKAFDLFLTLLDSFTCPEKFFEELYGVLQEWLLLPQGNARLLALHSLQKLEESKLNVSSNEMVGVLQNALDAELVPLTIADYRNRIKYLDKLNFERLGVLQNEQHKVLLKYLLGTLYCNFSLLWDPISEAVATYSVGMPINNFWEVFFSQLRTATANCKGMAFSQDFNLPELDDYLLNSVKFIKAEDRVGHHNYRNLLWNAMSLFSDLCETKNRDVVSIYLQFIQDDLLKSSAEHDLTINIQKSDASVLNNSNLKLDESIVKDKQKGAYPDILKCAAAQLKLLSQFKNPKQCYREPEVRSSYLELLVHKESEIQKLALECLLAYKFSFMVPYKQNLRNLIDDGKFKDELVHFQIDTETGVVKDMHREELMPIVMRILYSKMLYRFATPRGNKGSAILLRRSIILRFLAGSSHSEKEMFFKMAFKYYNSYFEGDVFDFGKIMNSVDLEKAPPPKKLQNTVNLAEVILNNFGGLMTTDLQRYIFKVLLTVGAFVSGIFQKRHLIHFGYIPSLRNLRTTCLDSVTKYFERFQKFPWTEDDINALFHVFVWPNLSKLPIEGVHSPTALLRLFTEWSKNPRYFKLMARHHPDDMSLTPLPFVMELLLNEKVHPSVTASVTAILENLLTLHEGEPMEVDDEEPPPPLEVNFILPIDETTMRELHLKEELNYGSKILMPHVGSILTFLRRKLEKPGSSKFGKSQTTILSRITEMATSQEHGDALMKLLMKLLCSTKQMGEEILVNMITTVENLTKIVPDPVSYLRSLAVLFGTFEVIQARKILINLVVDLEERCPELKGTVAIVQELNAWNRKWVGQPDFEKRLNAFKKIRTAFDDENFNETDMSLRDSASFCVQELCPKVANLLKHKVSVRNQWIESILVLTRKGIVSEKENYQALSISLLGIMARECGELHTVLKDLSVLANKEDPEVDFFENAQHLQIYRRLKALLKFCSIAKTLQKPPSTRTLVQFILPLASRYLCNEKFSDKNTLVDAAIAAVATVCRFLPWQQYQTVLRFYLGKLRTKIEFQKQLTRIVIAILDSFHFDISQSPAIVKETELPNDETFEEDDKRIDPETEKEETEELEAEKNKKEEETEEKKKEEEEEKEKIEQIEAEEETEEKKKEEEEKEKIEQVETEEEEKTEEKKKEEEKEGKEEEIERVEAEKKETEEKIEEEEPPKELEEVLEEAEAQDEELETEKKGTEGPAIDLITVLKPNAALKVEKTISGSFLGQLYEVIGQKTQVERTHKLNYKNLDQDSHEEDCLKIPVAVTVVKLLQKLPERMLKTQLPGIFMRLSTFLKSRMESVRRVARETLQQIMISLGPKYLQVLFSEMSAILTKGFQVHVLVYTMYCVIQHVQTLLQPGDIDSNLVVLLEACKTDLFGVLREEKDVPQIKAYYKEAKATKSYHLIHIIAQYITEKCLTDLILPVKEVLQNTYSHKNILRCREYLRHATLGLSANQFITNENFYIYVYGTTSESIPQLMPTPPEPPKKKNPKERQDCFIIPPEPKSRMGVFSNPVKKSSRSNAHIIVEFGLGLLLSLLKKDKVKDIDKDVRGYLDPIAPILVDALESQHVKVSTLALRCLSKAIKYDLPKIKAEVKRITDLLFASLHKYAAAGLCKGDNFDLVMATFKAVNTLIRETDYHGITTEQLKILLLYTEQDIYDTSRQATAFTLLKTILQKKLNSPELHELMKKVAALSITSELSHIRLQARVSACRYIMDYPLKKKLNEFIGFYLSQLSFEAESGRLSSLETLQYLVGKFPQRVVNEHSGVFLITLGVRLVNDDSVECKKMISGIIKLMLARLSPTQRNKLFDIVMVWFQQKKIVQRRLAAQIAGIFASVEKENFKNRLSVLLPVIQKQFVGDSTPGQFVKLPKDDAEEDRIKDHHLFQVLQLLLKICSSCPGFLTSEQHQENIYLFTEICQSLLCHPHEWVRLAAAQFLGYVFNSCNPSDVAAVLCCKKIESKVSFLEPFTIHRKIKSLILDHCAQFIPGVEIGQEFIDQITKNLVYFARVLKTVEVKEPNETEKENDDEDEDGAGRPNLTFAWLTRRMRRIINMELRLCASSKFLRTAVFNWIGAVVMCSTKPELKSVRYHLMAPLIREREIAKEEDGESPLKSLVMEILKVLKKKLGVDDFNREVIKIKGKIMERRMQRKRQRAQELVLDSEGAKKKKIESQARKKESRKRKKEKLKNETRKSFKRRKKNENGRY